MTKEELYKRASAELKTFSDKTDKKIPYEMFVRGYEYAVNLLVNPSDKDFFEKLAHSLRELWPKGEKDHKWPWRDSEANITKRLQFLWKERNIGDKYTIDDCLMAARKYLAQFDSDARYMQLLKYFIFKQNGMVGSDGKITYTYKSTLADLLDSSPVDISEWDDAYESSNTIEQGELI